MSAVFFTADTHFGHANIIKLCGRPFVTIDQMDAEMVRRWNDAVRPNDEVWHLGDFAYRADPERTARVFARLNGVKHLIVGNHDEQSPGLFDLPWASVHRDVVKVKAGGTSFMLFHYPLREWPGFFRDAVHLHGHVHGRFEGYRNVLDVGVDVWNFRPVSANEIRRRLETLPPNPDLPADEIVKPENERREEAHPGDYVPEAEQPDASPAL